MLRQYFIFKPEFFERQSKFIPVLQYQMECQAFHKINLQKMRITQNSRRRLHQPEPNILPPDQPLKSESNFDFLPQQKNNSFLQVDDMTKILAQSIRNSFIAQNVSKAQMDKIANSMGDHVDSNTIRLKQSPINNPRKFLRKNGVLEFEENNGQCCVLFSQEGKERMVRLENGVLVVETRREANVYICFDTVSVVVRKLGDKMVEITMEDQPESKFTLKSKNSQDAGEWFSAIKWTAENSFGGEYHLNKILEIPHFENLEFIIEEEFIKNCNSGDILLFKDNHTMAKIQRALTFSQYDHVALVLKNRKDQVVIFQSNSSSGVAFTFWSQLIRHKWYKNIDRIAWRRLNIFRDSRFISTMQQFIMKNLNKKFDLNVDKLFKYTSKLHKSEEEEKQRTYFCSELVAAVYKKLGLLELEKATTQYWPVSFSDARELALLKGELEHERVIVFEDAVLKNRR